MNTKLSLLIGTLALALAAGCSTVDSRIDKNRAAFNTWSPAVQDKVVKGQVDIGFTSEQVKVALGEPDRIFTRTSADGTSQIWSYRDRGPKFGFGVGVGTGSFGSRGGSFGSVGINTGSGYYDDEKMGVVLDQRGVVTSIETRGK